MLCFSSHDKARDASDAPFQGRRTAAPSMKLTHIMRLSTGALEDRSSSSKESSTSSTAISPSAIAEGMLMSREASGDWGMARYWASMEGKEEEEERRRPMGLPSAMVAVDSRWERVRDPDKESDIIPEVV
jgi:hypothetical protein